MKNLFIKRKGINILLFFVTTFIFSQTGIIKVDGLILDANKEPLPYVAVSILSKSIGTSSNDDGEFSLKLTKTNLNDSITFSTIGFKTLKIKVDDFLKQKEKVIVLEEDVVSLKGITLINSQSVVKDALKSISKTRYNDGHQLNILYRRFSTENKISRFLVEHYMKIYDSSPTAEIYDEIEVAEGRQSADYRFVKKKQNFHAIKILVDNDPLRRGIYIKDYKWSILEDTSYDGEELLVIEGRKIKSPNSFIRLFIGYDTKGIYKIETSDLNATYIYKKNKDGKLVLSYHKREYKSYETVSQTMQSALNLPTNKMEISYRHEVIVIDVITNSDKIDVSHNIIRGKDIGDYKVLYNPIFWQNINLPPASSFYKANVKELEAIYGVPLEVQFKAAN